MPHNLEMGGMSMTAVSTVEEGVYLSIRGDLRVS